MSTALKLEVGKRYVTADGKVTSPLEYDQYDNFYPFRGTLTPDYGIWGNENWTADGRYMKSEPTPAADLVAEYVEPGSEEQPATATVTPDDIVRFAVIYHAYMNIDGPTELLSFEDRKKLYAGMLIDQLRVLFGKNFMPESFGVKTVESILHRSGRR